VHHRDPECQRAGLQDQAASVGVDHHLALAALDLLACIITSRTTTFGGLHALAVEHNLRGWGLPADPLAVGDDSRWLMVSNRPASRPRLNQRKTMLLGGRSVGNSRQAMPPRRT
jgi:hypothetical protein